MIDELMAAKRVAREAELYSLSPAWRAWMEQQQAEFERIALTLAKPAERDLAPLDALLRQFVRDAR